MKAARKKNEKRGLIKGRGRIIYLLNHFLPNKEVQPRLPQEEQVDHDFLSDNKDTPELSASGIDDALSALALTGRDGGVQTKDIDKHPERRVKAAYAAYEEKRLPEMRKEEPGLRLQQMKNLIFKEFQKSPENPMNQDTNIKYNATRDEVDQLKTNVKSKRQEKFA